MVYYQALGTILLLPWFELLVSNYVINWSKVHNYNRSFNCQFGPNFHISDCNLMERLDLRNFTDQIKALGILVAVLGAFVVTLSNFVGTRDSVNSSPKLISKRPNWSLDFYLDQFGHPSGELTIRFDVTAKIYPDEVTIVFFYNLFGTIQYVIVSFFLVKGTKKGFFLYMIAGILPMCSHKHSSHMFVSMFDPLNVALAAFMVFVFLADGIYLGSVIGSTAIIVGFYAVVGPSQHNKDDSFHGHG
ncbi:LOW QUALITY PROTEIN: hypothetical protein V2J09_013659 [Rumex salicifolius]